MRNACAFGSFSCIIDYCSVTVTRIEFWFLRWFRGIKALHLTTINHGFFQIQFLTLREAADIFKCMFAKISAFLKSFLFLKLSYFCEYNQNSSEENTFSTISHFYTALVKSALCYNLRWLQSAVSGNMNCVQIAT